MPGKDNVATTACMNSILYAALALLSFSYQKCGNNSKTTAMTTDSIPACVQARIDEIKKGPKQNPPTTVEEYNYNGKRVFLFSAPCCDQYNEAVDEACNHVCAPSGGITGKGDRKCLDFAEKAQLVKTVWSDER